MDDKRVSIGWAYPDTDFSKIDLFEVVNGPSRILGNIRHPFNEEAIKIWEQLFSEGYRPTAVGGSDDHAAGQGGGDFYSPIGSPLNVVLADELSEEAILESLKLGKVFIITEGPGGPEVYLSATCGEREITYGETIEGDIVAIEAHVIGGMGMQLTLLQDGIGIPGIRDMKVTSDDFSHSFNLEVGSPTRIRAELREDSILKVFTNHIYIEPAEAESSCFPAEKDTGCSCQHIVSLVDYEPWTFHTVLAGILLLVLSLLLALHRGR